MKKNIIIGLLIVAIICLSVFLFQKNRELNKSIAISKEWENATLLEREIPSVNEKASKFVHALHDGKHKKYLTGNALEQYNQVANDEKYFNTNESYEMGENEFFEIGDKDLKIIISNTETKDGTLQSKIFYQLKYKGVFDNVQTGSVDQRIYTMNMTINWKLSKGTYKVAEYYITPIDDFMNVSLLSEVEK